MHGVPPSRIQKGEARVLTIAEGRQEFDVEALAWALWLDTRSDRAFKLWRAAWESKKATQGIDPAWSGWEQS